MDEKEIVAAIDRNTEAIRDGVKTVRKWVVVYVIFWSICWFAFVAFWVWRYMSG